MHKHNINKTLKVLELLTSKRIGTQLTGGYLPCQENCTEFTHGLDTGGASEARSSQANNVLPMSSQELSYLFQNSLLQITENTAKPGITLAPNAKLINCGIKQRMKRVR